MSTHGASVIVIPTTDRDDGDVAEGLRGAVCSEAYEDTLSLLADYSRRFEQMLRVASDDPKEAERLVTEANDLLQWAKNTVSANRAHTQAKLSKLNHAAQYLPAKRGPSRTWLVEA